MQKPLVSIIIPVFNVEKYLRECLDSVLNQTLTDFEAICINDGSTDSSQAILEEYAQKDNRIKLICKDNGGLSSARNAGINYASGEYITFLDSDDYLTCDALKLCYEKAKNDQLDMLVFCAKSFCENGVSSTYGKQYTLCPTQLTNVMSGSNFLTKSLTLNNHIGTSPIKLFRTDLIKENNIRFIEGILHEDEPFYYECILLAKRVTKIPNQFYCRRYRAGSITTTTKTSKHVIGKLVGINRILEISKSIKLSRHALEATMTLISAIANNLTSDYYSLDNTELEKLNTLPYEQQHLLQLLIGVSNGKRLATIEKSFSFKLGLALTKPIRIIADLFNH